MILALISITVVFVSLFLLYLCYSFIGWICSGKALAWWRRLFRKASKEENHEVEAAIATALDMYMNETVHDNESYIITIRRK